MMVLRRAVKRAATRAAAQEAKGAPDAKRRGVAVRGGGAAPVGTKKGGGASAPIKKEPKRRGAGAAADDKAVVVKKENVKDGAAAPPWWEKAWARIEVIRKNNPAPVDDMGCSALGKSLDAKGQRLITLLSLMLSSQTKDETTAGAINRLVAAKATTPDALLAMGPEKIRQLIYPVGFHNRKSQYITNAMRILNEEHQGDVPPTYEDVIKLPGVGPKMGHLFMTHAWGDTKGIGVDVHVHRISHRLGWVPGARQKALIQRAAKAQAQAQDTKTATKTKGNKRSVKIKQEKLDDGNSNNSDSNTEALALPAGVVDDIEDLRRHARAASDQPWAKSTPEATRASLEAWMPRDRWAPVNELLVGLGQTICTPRNPKCAECSVAPLCPSAFRD